MTDKYDLCGLAIVSALEGERQWDHSRLERHAMGKAAFEFVTADLLKVGPITFMEVAPPNPIREFECYPSWDTEAHPKAWSWDGKISIDLRWIASAAPHHTTMWRDVDFTGVSGTEIVLAGSDRSNSITINVAYPAFMAMWMEARR